jgi:hypothetical protein
MNNSNVINTRNISPKCFNSNYNNYYPNESNNREAYI